MKNSCSTDCCKVGVYAVAIIGTFLIVAGLAWLMIARTKPAPLTEDRANERRKAMTEMRAVNIDAMNNYAVLDATKNLVRLPIERAMTLTIQEWQNPQAARSNLIDRVEKATALPPEQPSEFE